MKKLCSVITTIALCLALLCVPAMANESTVKIQLADAETTVDGAPISTDESAAVYAANDIVFYLAGQGFTYGEGEEQDEHTQEEADAHTVVHITQPGTYEISGWLSKGQIAVDLGKDADEDPNAVVTLILSGADITCEVAPAVIFYNVYEPCDDDEDTASNTVDTSAAGANVIIADGTVNNVTGSYVARIYKSVELNEEGTEVVDSKKLHKYDGAFYSKMSMNINGGAAGDGVLNITAENEGLDSELHLTINGGNVNITSGNDGINTNEDNVSVFTMNGGSLNILVNGATGEGDGIDSNGWLVINGGKLTTSACGFSADAGIDSDKGIHINGGSISAGGNMLDAIAESNQTYVVFRFDSRQKGGSSYQLKAEDGSVVGEWTPANDFTFLIVSDAAITPGTYTLWQGDTRLQGSKSAMSGMPQMPAGMEFPAGGEMPEMPEGMEFPAGGEMPQMPEGMEFPAGGEMPQMPEGMEFPFGGEMPEGMEFPAGGEMPEMPDGMDFSAGGEMPGGAGDKRGGGRGNRGNQTENTEMSAEFVIEDGGNTFSVTLP